jgi:predicted aspartyl protease
MPRYDASAYDPPAPVAIVTLRPVPGGASSAGDSVQDVPLLIDTGADVTLLPRSAVDRMAIARVIETYELIGFDGTRSEADAVDLDVLLLGKAFRGRYLLTDDNHGVLGRDVLAALRLTFDGPRQEWMQT